MALLMCGLIALLSRLESLPQHDARLLTNFRFPKFSNISTSIANPCFHENDVFNFSTMSVEGIRKIYVIHWSKLANRRKSMRDRLSTVLPAGWEQKNFVAFITQYDSDRVTHQDVLCHAGSYANQQKKGQFSVTMKHHVAYYDVCFHQYGIVLIVEDDVQFAPDFVQKVSFVLKALPAEWSNCFVSACMPVHCTKLACLQHRGSGSNCAYGYLMSLTGSRLMLHHMPIFTTPDFQMNHVSNMTSLFHSYNSVFHRLIVEQPDGTDGIWKRDGQELHILS